MAKALISKTWGKDDTVVVRMSPEEASTVKAVLGRVAGSRVKSRRGYSQAVWDALDILDISSGEYHDVQGKLTFIPSPEAPKDKKVS